MQNPETKLNNQGQTMNKLLLIGTMLLGCLNVACAQRADGQPDMPKPPGMCDAEDALTKDPKGE